ncbi:hypothetical protein ARMSODRAFT_978168 [Armillaria solidipes]|uniref:Uncharacterized protein n=1 Tax=Armillaria solidipes TaxID=1076256 RepID=A0A2H3BRL0_9AGAR|nr:hypothetical protein ARMSODRAFT_978168 [Armillaria solidipes]
MYPYAQTSGTVRADLGPFHLPFQLKVLKRTNSMGIYLIKADDDRPYPVVVISRTDLLIAAQSLYTPKIWDGATWGCRCSLFLGYYEVPRSSAVIGKTVTQSERPSAATTLRDESKRMISWIWGNIAINAMEVLPRMMPEFVEASDAAPYFPEFEGSTEAEADRLPVQTTGTSED